MFDKITPLRETNPSRTLVFENTSHRKRSLLNVKEVALFLGVSPRTISDLVYKRRIPYRKVCKSLRFDPEEIEKWTLPVILE